MLFGGWLLLVCLRWFIAGLGICFVYVVDL